MSHTDSVPPGHGAIDNASGVGVLIGLAPRLASLDPACDVWLVATGSEERQVTAFPTTPVPLRSSSWSSPRADPEIFASRSRWTRSASAVASTCARRRPRLAKASRARSSGLPAGAAVTVRWARDSDTGNSDHREFELAGLPGAVLEVWKGVFPCHHLACDRAGLLQKPALKRALRIAEEVVKGL